MDKNLIDQLRQEVFSKQTTLAEIFRLSGSLSLSDYVSQWNFGILRAEGEIFNGALKDLLEEIYGQQVAAEAANQFNTIPMVSTIDHLGLLNHPFFINSNLIFSLRRDLKYLIVLPTAGVSMNNSSWPGCLVRTGENNELIRYSLFSDKDKTRAAFGIRAIGEENIAKLKNEIKSDKLLADWQKDRLLELVSVTFANLGAEDFSTQCSRASAVLWQKFFPGAPKLLYCPLEKLVSKILVRISLGSSEHLLYRLLFTNNGWQALDEAFREAHGAFSAGHKGSFLFWGMDKKGRRVRMRLQGDIISGNNTQKVVLRAEVVGQALAEGKIYSTSLVCFLVLLYFGVTAVGGFNQVNWLTNIKVAFSGLLKKWGEEGLAENVLKNASANFAESGLAFLGKGRGIHAASGLDIYLQNRQDRLAAFHELARKISVRESVETLLPEIYKVITPAGQRDMQLSQISDETIMRINGSLEKIARFLEPG